MNRASAPSSRRSYVRRAKKFRRTRPVSEIRLDIVLSANEPSLHRRQVWILADLDQPGRPVAFLGHERRSALNEGFLRKPIEIAAAHFDIGAGFGQIVPRTFRESRTMSRFDGVFLLGRGVHLLLWCPPASPRLPPCMADASQKASRGATS